MVAPNYLKVMCPRIQIPIFALCALSLTSSVFAQGTTTPATARPVQILNGDFARSSSRQDLWSGVDTSGFLIGARASVNLLTEAGGIGQVSVAPSVAIADMNADGLPDIVTADAQGYLRIYFNQGSATDPKFGTAEVIGLYLGVPPEGLPAYTRLAPRISVVSTAGRVDILIGNYNGEIFLLKNEGTPNRPIYRQPVDFARVTLPTTERGGRRWGNLFAPIMFDWDSNGRPDLLIGEGSYSANNIHLALNQGTAAAPKFVEAQRMVLAFGDGREQLSPAIVDYNGNGKPDLLVAARDGKIGVHLHPDTPWKPGDELKFSSFIPGPGGRELTLGGSATIAAGDLNGDGLFDIVAGRPNGRLSIVLNSGTKTEPKFGAPVDLKSEVKSVATRPPVGWDIDVGFTRGNVMGDATVVKAADDPTLGLSGDESALRIGYAPNTNKVLGPPYIMLPAIGNFLPARINASQSASAALSSAPSNYAMVRQVIRTPLVPGKAYTFSFKVRGSRVTGGQFVLSATGSKRFGEDRQVVGDRGRVTTQRNTINETFRDAVTFNPGGSWTEVKRSFTVKFKERDLSDIEKTDTAVVDFLFQLAPGDGALYIKDVKVEG